MLPYKLAKDLKVGDRILGDEEITKIDAVLNFHNFRYTYIVQIAGKFLSNSYKEDSKVIMSTRSKSE